jgi:hypothetical protein
MGLTRCRQAPTLQACLPWVQLPAKRGAEKRSVDAVPDEASTPVRMPLPEQGRALRLTSSRCPRTYYSKYDENWSQTFVKQIQLLEDVSLNKQTWVILDDTALGHETAKAVWWKILFAGSNWAVENNSATKQFKFPVAVSGYLCLNSPFQAGESPRL